MNTQTTQEAVSQKETELQAELTAWMNDSGLFSPGDRILVSLELRHASPVIIAKRSPSNKGRRYEPITNEISESEWTTIIACLEKIHDRRAVEFMQKSGNIPLDYGAVRKIASEFKEVRINDSLVKAGLLFRIKNISRNSLQMFKVKIR